MENEKPIVVKNLVKSFALLSEAKPFDNLRNRLPRVVVLNDISFEIKPGELLGVMGNNGEGKSTLLRVLAGIYGYDSGTVSVKGEIASIFELGSFMNKNYTGRQYCHEYLYLLGNKSLNKEALIQEIQAFTELEEYFDAPIHTYSSGMQAKLLFALATALPADIFLIDEILMVGDAYFQGKAWKRLRHMLQQGNSGVIVTHDWRAVLRLCKESLLLEKHRAEFLGDSFTAVRKYLKSAAEVVRSDEIYLHDEAVLLAHVHETRPGDDFLFNFRAEVSTVPEDGRLAVYYYLGSFIPGIGWQVIFSSEAVVEISEPGTYEIQVHIPNFPLAPGEYHAALELVKPLRKGQKAHEKVYVRLNWLNEHALRVRVLGHNPQNAILAGRVKWTQECT